MDGIVAVNKPTGKTSHDIVNIIRRICGQRRVGHTGTLDPEASGVLPICIGNATKAADMLTDSDKCYEAQLVLGMTTDTQDAQGEVLTECGVDLTREEIEDAVMSFVGEIDQIPPMYSALKRNGKKLYELAREGKEVERKPRRIVINSIKIHDIDMQNYTVRIEVSCSKGTYIRTLCHDIGMKLGVGAYMNTLTRTKAGPFTIEESKTVDELFGGIEKFLIPTDRVFEEYERIDLNDNQRKSIVNGVRMTYRGAAEGKMYRLYDSAGTFLCVSRCEEGKLRLVKSFWN